MELQFLSATEADRDVIFAQCKALIDAYEDVSAIDYDRVLDWVQRKIRENISSYTCVWLKGEKVAYFRLCPEDRGLELDDLYVLPPFRGRGIGRRIVKHCIDHGKTLSLYVFTANTGAMRLYENLGFRIDRYVGTTRCIMIREAL